VIKEVLSAYAVLLANTNPGDAEQTKVEIEKFHKLCVDKERPILYINFMEAYCKDEKSNIEENYFYTSNILEFMNDPNPEIIKGVIAAMTSIFGRLSKE
jgi:hypothetical protein